MIGNLACCSVSEAGGIQRLLTVAILARDEESVLAPSLESASQVGDRWLLADTGSQDRTRLIGHRYGAQVIQVPWEDSFAAARNQVLQKIEPTWVLWLDAGEQVDPGAVSTLREFLRTEADPRKVYWVKVVLPSAGPGRSPMEVFQLRLMPNHGALRFQGRIRETLRPAMETLGMQWAEAPGVILCHSRRHHPDWKAQRAVRNLRIAHQAYQESTSTPVSLLLAMADALVDLGDLPHAKALYLQAVQQAGEGSVEQLEAYYGLLTTSETTGQEGERLLAYGLQAVERFPQDAQLLCLLGQLLGVQGRWALAGRAWEQAFRHGQVCRQVWHVADLRALAGWGWVRSLDHQQRPEEALAALQQVAALTEAPWIRRRLMERYVQLGRTEQAMQEMRLLRPQAPAEELSQLAHVVQGASLAAQNDYQAGLPLLEAAYRAGCRDPLCLQWLVAARMATEGADSAEPVLREWERIDPAHPELPRYGAILHRTSSLQRGN